MTTRVLVTKAALGLAAIGIVAVGLVGVGRYVWTYWEYRGFAPPSAPRYVAMRTPRLAPRTERVVTGSLIEVFVPSRAVEATEPVYVFLPPGYSTDKTKRYPTLYLLHGAGGKPLNFVNAGNVDVDEEVLIAQDRMAPMILVMPSGAPSIADDDEWANGISPHSAWATYLARDVVHYVDTHFRTIAQPAARGLAGYSEGGYGALNIGFQHVGEFALFESWSGYMQADNIASIFGNSAARLAQNSPADTVRTVAAQLRREDAYVWFYVGTTDYENTGNVAFAHELTQLHVAHQFLVEPGSHTWRLWRLTMPSALIEASNHLFHG